jgi:tail protein
MEHSVPHSLTSTLGTFTFNDGQISLTQVREHPGVRVSPVPLALRDGGVVPDAYLHELYLEFDFLVHASSFTARTTVIDQLRSHLQALLRADGTHKWTPSGASGRQRTVRAFDIADPQGGVTKSGSFALVASDPAAYAQTQQTVNSTPVGASPTSATVTNGGEIPTWPILQLNGAITNPTVENQTTGKKIELDLSSLVIANATYVEIDTRAETVILNTTGASQIGKIDPATSEFFTLAKGSNTVRMTGSSPGANAKLTVLWRDAWL